jgi:anti-sigma factor RsiW
MRWISSPGRHGRRRHRWTQERLSEYLENELGSRARRRLEAHLASCADCSRTERTLRVLLRWLRRLPPPAHPKGPLVDGVIARLVRERALAVARTHDEDR